MEQKTAREKALEHDIYEACQDIADIALWFDTQKKRLRANSLSNEEFKFLFLRLDSALARLDFVPSKDCGYTYQD